MRRRRVTVPLAAALLVLALAAALLGPRLLERAADGPDVTLPAEQAIATRASLEPDVHLFAEPVVARLHVAVDRRRIDPDSVRVEWDFAPYVAIGDRVFERRDDAHVTHLVHSVELRCLELPCVPPRLASDAGEQETGRGERHTFRFPAALVSLAGDVDPRRVAWPPLEVVSRINAARFAAVAQAQAAPPGAQVAFPFAHEIAPARPTYTAAPGVVAAVALAGALLLLVVPSRQAVGWIRARRRTPAEAWALLAPRERARLLAAWAAGRDDAAERRRALELAAAELGLSGDAGLAAEARELAWSDRSPAPGAATELAEALDGRGNGRAR